MGVLCSRFLERLPDLLGYTCMCHIARASQRYKWPSWVVFDQNFRQLAADQGLTSLAHLDPTQFTQCFNGQGRKASPGVNTATSSTMPQRLVQWNPAHQSIPASPLLRSVLICQIIVITSTNRKAVGVEKMPPRHALVVVVLILSRCQNSQPHTDSATNTKL